METIFGLLVPASFVLFLVLERAFPARELPRVRGWLVRGVAFFVLTAVVAGLVPALLSAALGDHTVFDLRDTGVWIGGAIAAVVTDLIGYVFHRVMHNVPWLWRWTHQMHHSAERIDVAGAAIFHPLEIAMFTVLTTLVVIVLGVTPAAAAFAGYVGFFIGTFQHLNVRTPRWLGYIIQRPEAHAIHHSRGVHAYNYGGFMLWDIALGTFRNPASFTTDPAGFWDGASRRLFPMLVGRDVTEPTH